MISFLKERPLLLTVICFLTLLFVISAIFSPQKIKSPSNKELVPTPTDTPFTTYVAPHIPRKDVYRIVMVGDSMTEALGPYGGKLSEFLNTAYQSTPGHQRIVIDNYAKGATNILGLPDTLTPLLTKPFNLILIESFGYNPLSQFPLSEGLKKQTEALDDVMNTLLKKQPDALIVFVATIAPNKETYAQEVSPGKTIAEKTAQAEERMTYIKNHIAFAKSHSIPLIDIYSKSLTAEGNGNLLYINPNDHIHPSFAGIDFISHEITDFIYNNQLLLK